VPLVLGATSAVLSIVSGAVRLRDGATSLGVLLSEYTAHVHTFETLFQFGCTDETVRVALDAFAQTEQLEAKDHPAPNERLMERARRIVLQRVSQPTDYTTPCAAVTGM
jgi:hypothetical protein